MSRAAPGSPGKGAWRDPARRDWARTGLGLAGAAISSAMAARLGRRLPAEIARPWDRTNHAGGSVSLLEGPAWVAGAVVGTALAGGLSTSSGLAPIVVAGGAGGFGALDDLVGTATDKGLKGHLGALGRGQLTTGAVKVVGLGLVGLVGAALVDQPRRGITSTVLGAAVIAGSANAVNLFDLRPGRALKVVMAAATPLALMGSETAAAALGASVGVIGDDLAARSMLGDTGANAAGAMIGLALVERTGPWGRAAALGGLIALTLASERVSFTKVIADHDVLRRIDEWGRSTS